MSVRPLLLLPIETKAREFPSRVFLTGLALERGYDVILGTSKPLHRQLYKFPRGLILENDASPRSYDFVRLAREIGHKIVAWDEESLVTITDDIFAKLRVSPKTVGMCEYFFCRGQGDTEALKKTYPDITDKLIPVGNPRLDILYPKWFKGGAKVKEKKQKTILINSRFSIVNPFYVSKEKAFDNVFKKAQISKESEMGQHIYAWLNHAHFLFLEFADLTHRICKEIPEAKVVIRPHPSENHQFWKDLASEYNNAEYNYDGAASDWFLKSDVLVHSGCTTALEASSVGLPCMAYLPDGEGIYDIEVPNSVSEKFFDANSLIEALKMQPILTEQIREKTSTKTRKALSTYITNFEDGKCTEAILDTIDAIELDKTTYKMRWKKIRNFLSVSKGLILKYLKDRKEKNHSRDDARKGYASQKFPGLSSQEIEALLNQYGFNDFVITKSVAGWYRVSSKKGDGHDKK